MPPKTLNFQHQPKIMSKIDDASNNGKQQFNQASNPQPAQQGKGSDIVNKPPSMEYNMNNDTSQSYNERLAKERVKAEALKTNAEAKTRVEQQKQVELDKDNDKEK